MVHWVHWVLFMWFGGALEPAHNMFSPNFLTFPTFPAKLNAKMGFFAKTKFAELIVYKKATF